jgi:hypothetical protein
MTGERNLRALSKYLEFGVRLHWEDFIGLTAGALLAYLPFSLLAIYIHPSVEDIFKGSGPAISLVPRILFSQFIIRVIQTFVLVLIILRLESRRAGDEDVWDVAEAYSRLGRVVAVDLAYFVGIQLLGILALWLGLMIVGLFLGDGPMGLPIAISVAAFVVIGPAVRYYFASLVSLLHGTSFSESFRMAGDVSSGGERLIAALVMTYMMVWFIVWQLFHGLFGGEVIGQIIVQAGMMTTSIPYFFSGYLLYLDLVPETDDRVMLSGKGNEIEDHFEGKQEGAAPEENHSEPE